MSPRPRGNVKLLGVERVMRNLQREVRKIKQASMRGLIEAAYVIRRDMDQTPPLIPVDQGNLRASAFITAGYGNLDREAGKFKGDDKEQLSSDHSKTISSAAAQAGSSRKTNRPIVIIGFSARYAPFVEGRKGAAEWKRPGSGPEFFKSSLERNRDLIIKVIAESAKRK